MFIDVNDFKEKLFFNFKYLVVLVSF
jgi:hypothetical protein